jgi:hypothetical protein
MNRYEYTFSVDAEDEQSSKVIALRVIGQALTDGLSPIRVKNLGFVHPDEIVRECAPPPAGFELYHLHETETGIIRELPVDTYFAIPEGQKVVNGPLPVGSIRWDEVKREWSK